MKKIINGKMYDTDTSEEIYLDENKNRHIFKTMKGNYFLLYSNGEIVPKTENEVKELLGLYNADRYIELFGEVEEA